MLLSYNKRLLPIRGRVRSIFTSGKGWSVDKVSAGLCLEIYRDVKAGNGKDNERFDKSGATYRSSQVIYQASLRLGSPTGYLINQML
jgi:hypothetical protein